MRLYDSYVGDSFRVVNNMDVVARLPRTTIGGRALGYAHAGRTVMVSKDPKEAPWIEGEVQLFTSSVLALALVLDANAVSVFFSAVLMWDFVWDWVSVECRTNLFRYTLNELIRVVVVYLLKVMSTGIVSRGFEVCASFPFLGAQA